jgi:hypothetical protein
MGTFLNVDGDPNEVAGTGAVLRSIAESFKTETQAVLGEINAVHAERPWGSDQYGNAFETTYYAVPDGAEESLPDLVETGMNRAGDGLSRVGDGTILAMTEFQGTDIDNATRINETNI